VRSALTLNFNDRYTTPCGSSIRSGLSPTAIVRRANLMNRALLSCLDSLREMINYQKKIMSVSTMKHASWRRHALPLREAIPLWFAISSPLIGVMIGLLGAWFVTWLTT